MTTLASIQPLLDAVRLIELRTIAADIAAAAAEHVPEATAVIVTHNSNGDWLFTGLLAGDTRITPVGSWMETDDARIYALESKLRGLLARFGRSTEPFTTGIVEPWTEPGSASYINHALIRVDTAEIDRDALRAATNAVEELTAFASQLVATGVRR